MKLAFSGKGKYANFDESYELYKKRAKYGNQLDRKTYNRVVKDFFNILALRLLEDGMVDIPVMGMIVAAEMTRKPQYRGKKFIGYGAMDWKRGHFDGKIKTFGIVFLPRRSEISTLRSLGFVSNRALFKKMKNKYESGRSGWSLLEFKDDMI